MGVTPTPDPYTCPICGTTYVVPSLATDCLTRHEKETAP